MIKEFAAKDLAELKKKANSLKLCKEDIVAILYVQSEYKLIYDDRKDQLR